MKKLIFLIGIILLVVGAVLFGTNYTKARAAAKEELKTNVIDINIDILKFIIYFDYICFKFFFGGSSCLSVISTK